MMIREVGHRATESPSRGLSSTIVSRKPSGSAASPTQAIKQRVGNLGTQRLIREKVSQPIGVAQPSSRETGAKLGVYAPVDIYEQEANRVEASVMTREVPATNSLQGLSSPSSLVIQRKCTACSEQTGRLTVPVKETSATQVSRGGAGRSHPKITSSFSEEVAAMQSGGSPLPAATRTFFEPRFGADFGHVRVHTDSHAARTADSINARAFTVGNNIAFAQGEYAPHSSEGRRLIAHELTHVVQQDGSRVQAMRKPSSEGDRKSRPVDVENAKQVVHYILEIINKVRPIDISTLPATSLPAEYKPLLRWWVRLSDERRASRLSGYEYLDVYQTALAQTEPLVRLLYAKGGSTWRSLLLAKWMPLYIEFEKRADSERRILHLLATETSYPFDPQLVDIGEFLRVASANKTRPMVLQRGAGIQVGAAVAGKVYHASQKQPRLVLWASPGGLFYEENGALFKQSQAGFSNDIVLGIVIKAAEDVGPFVSLVTAIVDIAISLTPVGWVYDLTNAARAVASGDWKSAALELLPGPAINGLGKVAKATRVGRAALAAGAKGFDLVGRAFRGVKTFVAKGLGKLGRNKARGMWLVTDGGKTYHFADEADGVWREVNKVDAEEFIKCSSCRLTSAGKADSAAGTTTGGKSDVPSTTQAGQAADAGAKTEVEELEQIYGDILRDNAKLRLEFIKARHMRMTSAKGANRAVTEVKKKLAKIARRQSREYMKNLVERYPKLRQANLRPRTRPAGEPGAFEESVFTGSGKESWVAKMRDGKDIELDDIDPRGFVVDTKMRDLGVGKELPESRTADVVEEIGGGAAPRSYPKFPEKEQQKLLRQLRFAEENSLAGVRWETNSVEVYEEVRRYTKNVLSASELKRFSIVLVDR